MVTSTKLKIQEIVEDLHLSTSGKIEKLREIETEVRGLQRAASESPMNPSDGWDDELSTVRKALDAIGAEPQHKGAATL